MNNQSAKPNIWLIASVSLATILIVGLIAFALGFFGSFKISPLYSQSTETATTVIDLKIKGNKNSKIYHVPGCPNYDDIAKRNIRWFKTRDEAKSAGFRMARNY